MAAPIIAVGGPSGAGKTTVARLLARSFDPSVHLQGDAFMPFVVNGWVDPWRAEAARQNEVMGAAVGSAAIHFARGGYAVILDGGPFPDAIDGFAGFCRQRNVALHYAVLRPDLETCLARIRHRLEQTPSGPAGRPEYVGFFDREAFAQQHARFSDLGGYEVNVVDAADPPEHVAQAVLAAMETGRLLVADPAAGDE